MADLYHLSYNQLNELKKRAIDVFNFGMDDRKKDFVKLRNSIPLDVIAESKFTYEFYNWACSIIDSRAFTYKLGTSGSPNALNSIKPYNPIIGLKNG